MTRGPLTSPLAIFRTLRSISAWVGMAIVASVTGLWLVQRFVPREVLAGASDTVGNYLQTLGTIYAVLLAFVVFMVWQQFNEVRANVEGEANELVDLARTVRGMPHSLWQPLLALVQRYVEVVLCEEWPAMAAGSQARFVTGAALLDEIWDLLIAYEPQSSCHELLYEQALVRFNDVSDRRMSRLSSSRQRVPLALRILLYTGAIVTAASMWLFVMDSFALHVIMTAALAGAISHILYVISDLDDCFRGNWQVPRSQFEEVAVHVAKFTMQASAARLAQHTEG